MQPEERLKLFEQTKYKLSVFLKKTGANYFVYSSVPCLTFDLVGKFYQEELKPHPLEVKVETLKSKFYLTSISQEHIDELLLFEQLFQIIFD